MMSKETKERDKLIYEIVCERYKLERQRTNDIDSKASNVVGFAGILATLNAGIIGLFPESSYKYVLLLPLIPLGLSIAFGLWAYWIEKFEAINPTVLIEKYKDKPSTEVLRRFVATTSEMTMINYAINWRKVKSLFRALSTLFTGIILFLSLAVILLVT